jgi:hypothetical protein
LAGKIDRSSATTSTLGCTIENLVPLSALFLELVGGLLGSDEVFSARLSSCPKNKAMYKVNAIPVMMRKFPVSGPHSSVANFTPHNTKVPSLIFSSWYR